MSSDPTYLIEPCLLDEIPATLADVIAELSQASADLGAQLHPVSAASLADLVRVMNCYYSNLIEGHNTRPRDIQRALEDDLDGNSTRRELQLEARAHIRVQREIDTLSASGAYGEPASRERIRWLHRECYADAPAAFLRVPHAEGQYEMVSGEFRSEPRHDVAVGRLVPPSSARIQEFMHDFEQRYRLAQLGLANRIVARSCSCGHCSIFKVGGPTRRLCSGRARSPRTRR